MATKKLVEPTEAIGEELATLTRDVPVVVQFHASLREFFKRASALDSAASLVLKNLEGAPVPKTARDDALMQQTAKHTSEAKKEVENHWAITQVAHSIHKALTSMRKKTTDKLDRANAIANQLHNSYVEAERRRVEREQREAQEKAEAEERRVRQEEQERLEREALEREAQSPDLTRREELFLDYYVRAGATVIEAARRAGYKNPSADGVRLIESKKIQAAITAMKEADAIRRQAAAKAAEPVVVDVPEVAMNVTRAAGTTADRETWLAECFDADALIKAVIAQKLGIPLDVLEVDRVRLNQYARSLHEKINDWPGVKAKKTTKVV